ncbi:alcohol dehydrogenase catalytic domain-containing protein [Actinacidiphila glaucinigra]
MTAEIPATSRAAALTATGEALRVLDVEIPAVIERDALLVRMTAATLCGTDVHVADGSAGDVGGALPLILGHEMVGRIAAFGDGPRTDSLGQPLAEGDRVVWTHGMCGRCRACVIDGEPSLCENRRRYMTESAHTYPFLHGGFSEYGYVYPTAGRVRVPDDVPDAVASAAACSLRTVMHGFERLGRIAATDTVVVQGAGPVGLFAVAKAVAEGAGPCAGGPVAGRRSSSDHPRGRPGQQPGRPAHAGHRPVHAGVLGDGSVDPHHHRPRRGGDHPRDGQAR